MVDERMDPGSRLERRSIASSTTEFGVLEGGFSRLSWRSVFGGMFTALSVWILLGAFGLALGLSMISPEDPSLGGAATWMGIWALIVPILALSVGTFVATRAASGTRRATGVLYGVVVWGLTTFATTVLGVWLMGSVVGQTLQTGTQIVSGVGGAAASAAGSLPGADPSQAAQEVGEFLDVDRSEIVAALNDELQQEGLPPIQPEQLEAALQNAVNTALQQGNVSAQIFEDALVQETSLERQQVQQVAQQLQEQWDQVAGTVTGELRDVAGAAGDAALASLDTLGNVMWLVFGSLLLGLLASIGTGVLATNGRGGPTPAERIPVARLEERRAVG